MKTNNPVIVIAIDPYNPNRVFAYDMTNGKREAAKCSPEDEFNFGVGAKLALERLFPAKEKVNPCRFKVGDIIIGNEKANKYAFTRQGWVGKVVSVFYDSAYSGMLIKAESITSDGSCFELDPDAFDLAYNYEVE